MEEMEEGQYGQMLVDMEEGQMMDEEESEGDGEEMNFDDNPEYAHMPPLDKMRKIRREILRTINEARDKHGAPSIYIDVMANKAATDYANFLMTNPEDAAQAEEFCKQNNVVSTVTPLVGFAILEEDEDHQGPLQEQMMDAHGLLLELEYELKVLCDPNNTHIGIGFSFNKEQVKVVEFVS